METMVKEHRYYLEAEKANWEMVQHGFVRNLDLPVLKMYEHIYRLYLDPNFVLTVWCSNCVMDMIRRLYKHYESLPIENIEETIVEVQIEIKKRGRKPKK
jgi:hypothetical protein